MHILVTGGAGFIGSHLVDALLEAGHDVTVFDNLSTGCRDQVPEQARFVQGDIRDEAALKALFGEGHFDVVFHEAAQTQVSYSLAHPREDAELNVLGLINVLEQCRRQGVQKFIYSSSAAVYGDNPKVPLDESEPLAPASFYGLTKVTAENISSSMATCSAFPMPSCATPMYTVNVRETAGKAASSASLPGPWPAGKI